MKTKQQRYFLSKVIQPYQEYIHSIRAHKPPIYFDSEYSPLREKVENLALAIHSLFTQPEFQVHGGVDLRNDLNGKHSCIKRLLSLATKAKHGSVTNQYFLPVDLSTDLCVFIFADLERYAYGYSPTLRTQDTEEHFSKDFADALDILNSQLQLRLRIEEFPMFPPEHPIQGNKIKLHLQDPFNFLEDGAPAHISTYRVKGQTFIKEKMSYDYEFAIFGL